MIAEKIRKLLAEGVEAIDTNIVVGQEEHDDLMSDYGEALIELEELEKGKEVNNHISRGTHPGAH